MKIVFTSADTGGHFYPIIAITEALQDIVREEHLLEPTLYYLGPKPFDEKALFENSIEYIKIPAGKIRRYFSFRNVTDLFLTFIGLFAALVTLYRIYPDVVFSKSGYGSVPVVLAARFLRIPVVVHESDAKPGRATLLAAKFATKIAISFDSAAKYFPKKVQDKIARTGVPVRKALSRVEPEGAVQYLGLEAGIPTIFIMGGSQGSVKINETVISVLPDLISFANIIHQTGPANLKMVQGLSTVTLNNDPHMERYHPIAYLDQVSIQRAAGIADVVISRAGAGTIAEIGLWGKPAILIPIPESVSHDQKTNAYAYAETGGAVVIEEENLTPHLFLSEIKRILGDKELSKKMGAAAKGFTDADAATILAKEVVSIALSHEES